MKRLAGLLGCAALLFAVSAFAAAPKGFTPKTLAGKWSGTWTNTRFGSTGPTVVTIRSLTANTKLQFTVDFGGNVFGCTDPPAESSKALTKGTGFGHWNSTGFKLKGPSKAFGTLTIAYSDKTKNLVGSGGDPACAAGLKWKLAGKFAGKTFTGTVNITLPDSSTALSNLSLTRP